MTVTIGATVGWTATGPLELHSSHSRDSVGRSWTAGARRTSMRPAMADLTFTGRPGGTFAATTQDATLQSVKVGTLAHE